jgi:hypothetical protein
MSDTVINGLFTLAGVVVGFLLAQGQTWWTNRAKAKAVSFMLTSEIDQNLEMLRQFVDALQFGREPVDHNNLGVAHLARGRIAQQLIRTPLPDFTHRILDASPDLFMLGAAQQKLHAVTEHYVLIGRIRDIHTRLCAFDHNSQRFVGLLPDLIANLRRYAETLLKKGNPVRE